MLVVNQRTHVPGSVFFRVLEVLDFLTLFFFADGLNSSSSGMIEGVRVCVKYSSRMNNWSIANVHRKEWSCIQGGQVKV